MLVSIQAVDNFRQATDCVRVQRRVWGFSPADVVTPEMLLGCVRHGGIALAAFPPQRRLVGFVFSLPAPLGGDIIQHSHMLAVLPEFQDRGIGRRLKWAQFEEARQRNCSRITWTYDPLEARNAFLNLNKLGAQASRYYLNLYGDSTSSRLHQGIGTDRLLAEWPVASAQESPMGGAVQWEEVLAWPRILEARVNPAGRLEPGTVRLDLEAPRLALEIPAAIQQLKRVDLSLAQAWRERTREAFLHYLGRGYHARGVMTATEPASQSRRVFYCLGSQGQT